MSEQFEFTLLNETNKTILPDEFFDSKKLTKQQSIMLFKDIAEGELTGVFKYRESLIVKQMMDTADKAREGYDVKQYLWPHRWSETYSDEQLDDLLLYAAQCGANDIILATGNPIRAKINSRLYTLTESILTDSMMAEIAKRICTAVYLSSFTKSLAYNTRYSIKRPITENRQAGDRIAMEQKSFRVNNHQIFAGSSSGGASGMEITLRVINDKPFEDKTIPREIKDVFRNRNGIILIVGATGTGKSSFMASLMVDKINDPLCNHRILTLEAPIEFDFANIPQTQTVVTQSEVPRNIDTFERGIEETLRRAPDDLLIGEMRDHETISAGLLAAQTGMLVYSTMHVNRVADTIPRIISTTKDNSIVYKLLDIMRLVVSQDLLHKIGGGRIAVREYLIFDKDLMKIIEMELKNPDTIAQVIDQLVFKYGIHFQVHARFLWRNRQIADAEFIRFMKSRNFSLTPTNLALLDARVDELSSSGHEMFTYTCEDPIPANTMIEELANILDEEDKLTKRFQELLNFAKTQSLPPAQNNEQIDMELAEEERQRQAANELHSRFNNGQHTTSDFATSE